MIYKYIKEPLLEFGNGDHICPKIGISNHNVYDTKFKARRENLLVGAVGTSDNLNKLSDWLKRCSKYIPGKLNSDQPKLFQPFCGFNEESGFKSTIKFNDEITRSLKNSDIKKILEIKNRNELVNEAADLFYNQVKFLAQNRVVDVIICVLPNSLYDLVSKEDIAPIEENIEKEIIDDKYEVNFRRLLKAKCMHLGKPIQLMRELSLKAHAKGQQDEATKAWNFCTAIYYKSNNTVPWRLISNINRPSVCYVGIGFYRSRDKKVLNTSLAQIFDELGNGVILRGTPVNEDKKDRIPHISADQAFKLLVQALKEYEIALGTSPARIVIHKTSKYYNDELDGFRQATKEMRVNIVDFVTLLNTNIRLLRNGLYPPYRGTHIQLSDDNHILYTRGAVDFYKTYTGMYIPQPLEVRILESDESPHVICNEILSLTKMNWNNTQFDGKFPITIACARKVGQIMKYLKKEDRPQISYSYYM